MLRYPHSLALQLFGIAHQIAGAIAEGSIDDQSFLPGRLTRSQLAEGLASHLLTVRPIPGEAIIYMQVESRPNAEAWRVKLPFWTVEEGGRSDLCLCLHIRRQGAELVGQIEDVHPSTQSLATA
ncbi:DUF7668 domain-containing protein [Nannocystis bainbridge]|uniref:DUF7668 domain-containing protein n=1 Tax=Nannocystis bainbridge TaxID=2995303 RepID=A0ABT5DSR6_9BACT|nr:hypothetical protein [Nannocystis bainbridge]MDC0716681.1 hypothetical protein [Nannocystis bainbridge]